MVNKCSEPLRWLDELDETGPLIWPDVKQQIQ
jgi:hypothetical protein